VGWMVGLKDCSPLLWLAERLWYSGYAESTPERAGGCSARRDPGQVGDFSSLQLDSGDPRDVRHPFSHRQIFIFRFVL